MQTGKEVGWLFEDAARAVAEGERLITLSGLTSASSKAFVLAALYHQTRKRFAIVTDTNTSAEELRRDIAFFIDRRNAAASLPAFETDIHSGLSPHAETLEMRALTLHHLRSGSVGLLTLPIRSLLTRLPSADEIEKLSIRLEIDSETDPELLTKRLIAAGYVSEEPIANVGQFSLRGGIVDVWPPGDDLPVRIEFFGDTVDSIREFDPGTQLSNRTVRSVDIAPMREYSVTADDMRLWSEYAKEAFSDGSFARALKDRTDFADAGETFGGWEFLLPMIRPLGGSVFDLIEDAIFVIDEPTVVEENARIFFEDAQRRYHQNAELGQIGIPPSSLYLEPTELRAHLHRSRTRIDLRALGCAAANTDEELSIDAAGTSDERAPLFLFSTAEKGFEFEITSRPTRNFGGRLAEFAGHIRSSVPHLDNRFVMRSSGMAERMEEIFREYDMSVDHDAIIIGDLSSGFELPAQALAYITESDIFGEDLGSKPRPKEQRQRRSKLNAFVSDFRDLKPGDHVVHIDHGLGRFEGLQTISSHA
ncbi:CarD family transcriptional regulator [Leptolyngbya sp. 7M]|uniref:CarD family transcriptional regulator n=1 Tax=Leptolyngbya sp. 7M TaxID=2812896 RepID=UPI001B8CC003|nr:CarD family transcriptional regulator [Leptolyngbya sp. 7M]QYO67948.1 hypothetical protein JVX88_14905 [Leptolyngbya sp. 7M]